MFPRAPEVTGDLLAYWGSASFRAEALRWVHEVLGERDVTLAGEIVPHRVRFWSAVLTIDTSIGTLWFKAANPGQAFEAPLLLRLSRLVPDHVVTPIGVEEARGWLLLPDDGPSVRERGEVTVAEWEALVVSAARMQVALTGHGKELADAGLPSLLPDRAHEYATARVETLARLPVDDPQHIDVDRARRLLRDLEDVGVLFAELASSGVPPTLQPNDAGAANAVRGPDGDGHRFFDLGDAFWSHPFAVLQVPLRMATGAWPHAPAATDVTRARLVRAYLEHWPQVAPGPDADRLVEAADRLAGLHRCESWRRLLAHVHPDRLGITTPRLADWLADAARPRRG